MLYVIWQHKIPYINSFSVIHPITFTKSPKDNKNMRIKKSISITFLKRYTFSNIPLNHVEKFLKGDEFSAYVAKTLEMIIVYVQNVNIIATVYYKIFGIYCLLNNYNLNCDENKAT